LREERRVRFFENRMLRRIFGLEEGRGKSGIEEITQRGTSRFVFVTRYYSGDEIKKSEMGRICSTYGREERCIQGFDWKT
jgi:hypothetical protein